MSPVMPSLLRLRGSAPLINRVRARAHRAAVQRRFRQSVTGHATAPAGIYLRALLDHFQLPAPSGALPATTTRYTGGWFDLLGSGWRPFTSTPGAPSPSLDWHVDVLSGHRWEPSTWHNDIDRAPGPGIDVKLPWELGRLQHLPQLALAYRHAAEGAPGFAQPERYRRAIEDQLIDFVANNPTGRGVQWGCTMDVGIRVANVLLALDILATGDASVSTEAQALVAASVHAHAIFILANLEWTRAARTNHYLADICGLVWAAAHLEGRSESDSWLCFGARELQAETRRQFDRDGAGREGSTSYHRLSAEMVTWTTAVLLSLPDDRVQSLRPRASDLANVPLPLRRRPPSPRDVVLSRSHLRAVARMPDLTAAVWRNGGVALVGDNDSGRFVKPAPAFRPLQVSDVTSRYRNLEAYDLLPADEVYWWEDSTDHGHLRHAVEGLFGSPGSTTDGALVDAYVRRKPARPASTSSLAVRVGSARPAVDGARTPVRRETLIVPGGDDLLAGLETCAFVSFGVYVWRSRRLFLAVRCGPLGQEGLGGHHHRDQLAIELSIDGVPWFRDPGSATYTRDPDLRNAYRSAAAHAGPEDEPEDWRRAPGLFELGPLVRTGVPQWYGTTGFLGERRGDDGTALRTIVFHPHQLEIVDHLPRGTASSAVLRSAAEAARAQRSPVPFSPGYGWQEQDRTTSAWRPPGSG